MKGSIKRKEGHNILDTQNEIPDTSWHFLRKQCACTLYVYMYMYNGGSASSADPV